MSKRSVLWIINLILFCFGLVLAYQGWQAWQHTTILVEWTTASELDTVGYNLYRSETSDQQGVRVNQELIPSSSDSLTGGSYRFEDRDVQAGISYYYQLEEVENSGVTNQAGVIEVTAKRSGWWEIGLALLLLGSSGVGLLTLAVPGRGKTV